MAMDPEFNGRWIYAIGKHLVAFRQDHVLTRLYATRRASQDGDLLLRLRRQGSVSATKTKALARDAGIPAQELKDVLIGLEATGLISVVRSGRGEVVEVQERIFTESEVFRAVTARFEAYEPEEAERAVVPLLDLLSRLPLTEAEAVGRLTDQGFSESAAKDALELHAAFHLLREREVPDLGVTVVYNEYLWGHKIDQLARILAGLRERETNDLLALMEEVRTAQGRSLDSLTAAPRHIVAMAANTGILDTVTIETASGREQTFTFSPYFHGYRAGASDPSFVDTSDHVKLFVASIQYGVHFSEDFRLSAPLKFVDKLLSAGYAGNATPIGRDYILLEREGIVATEATTGDKARFILQKEDVVRAARDVLASAEFEAGGAGLDGRFLVTQKGFRAPELNRVRADLAVTPSPAPRLENDLIASIREAAQQGTWR